MRSVITSRFSSILIFSVFVFWTLALCAAFGAENPCLNCHVELTRVSKSSHAPTTSACSTCHTPVEGVNHPEQKDSMRLVENVPGLCFRCHDKSQFSGKSVHPPIVSDNCTACHNPHQSSFAKILIKDIPGLCYNCHSESKFKGKLVHAPVAKGLCMGCHRPHASNFKNILISDSPQLCYGCHDKAPFTKKRVHVVATIPNGCNLCHYAHVSDQSNLLSKPIVQLCTSCHIAQKEGMHFLTPIQGQITHPISGVPDPSNPKKELSCVSCHNPHSSNFAKMFPIARICTKCHKYY